MKKTNAQKHDKIMLKKIQDIRKSLKKDFGLRCKKICVDCPECKAIILDSYLDWLEDSYRLS